MLNDIKIKYGNTFTTSHTRDYEKGKSFHFAGEWKQGCHYFNDTYCTDFVVYKSALLACAKSHLATRETEPIDLIFNEEGVCVGVKSIYWDFVLAGFAGNVFTDEYKEKLDGLNIKYDTTDHWDHAIGFIPKAGEIIIYSDYETREIEGNIIKIPGIKVGSGNAYVQDLAFIDEGSKQDLLNHINDNVRHITAEERAKWNNKLNVTDAEEVIEDTLIFNRK